METLKLDGNNARKFFPTVGPELKQIFIDTWGANFFSQKIADLVNSFDDILTISGRTLSSLKNDDDTLDEIAYKKAKLIASVYNEGVVLDPLNTNQNKYFPWFKISPGSGFGLSYNDYGDWYTYSFVGVRLCFKDSYLAIDAGKKFIDIYADLLIK